MRRIFGTPRAAGVWGIVFVVLLFVSAAMVSLPTAATGGERIVAFYRAHGSTIVIQQVVGLLALAAFVAFGLSLRRGRWLRVAVWFFVAAELATNIVPLLIVAAQPSAETAHTMTLVEDVSDSVLFLAIGAFVAAATLGEPLWLRLAAYVVAALSVLRALASPFGYTAFDAVAPLAFVLLVLVLSARLLIRRVQAV